MSASKQPKKILIMGAGDGMVLREVLKWPAVEKVVLIELDSAVVQLASNYPQLVKLNHNAFVDSRVRVIYGDALLTVPKLSDRFDVILDRFGRKITE
jgi:spermidine synthase